VIVLDTNVLSEAFKPAPSVKAMAWLAAQESLTIFVTAVTLAEVLYGVEALPPGKRRSLLAAAIDAVFSREFGGRILPFDEDAARLFPKIVAARTAAGRPISQFDAMIASIVRSRRATLATRNTNDFENCGVRIVNPWAP
jgi:Predicted nucleic acid-binding protein, contains PIN domain